MSALSPKRKFVAQNVMSASLIGRFGSTDSDNPPLSFDIAHGLAGPFHDGIRARGEQSGPSAQRTAAGDPAIRNPGREIQRLCCVDRLSWPPQAVEGGHLVRASRTRAPAHGRCKKKDRLAAVLRIRECASRSDSNRRGFLPLPAPAKQT